MRPILNILENWEKRIVEKRKEWKKSMAEKKAQRFLKRKHAFREHLWRAGITTSSEKISKGIFIIAAILNIALSIYLVVNFSAKFGFNLIYIIAALLFIWTIISVLFIFIVWLLLYLGLDVMIYRRKIEIEDVLPDFLQLTSANIRAGMPIDKALWFAVRPRFGVLAKEMEIMAKRTAAGEELEVTIRDFSSKYDSTMLKRSMYLLVEGLKAGGEVGVLLDRIATNIQQIQIMKKEMAASVTTYVIFITVAVIFAAPFLFALSNTLITMIQTIGDAISMPASSSVGMSFTFSSDVIDIKHFRLFAFTSLTVTSFFSSAIISTIQKGNIKAGLKYIPMFISATVFLFYMFSNIFSALFSGFF
ncbi:type II secretion system F family protein [Thermoproteota archaeon]